MKRTFPLLSVLLLFSITAFAQSGIYVSSPTLTVPQIPTPAKPEENARLKPLLDSLNKVQAPFIAKRNTLPESKSVTDAQKVVADAQIVLQKAIEARDLAAQKLPEFDVVKSSEARLLDEIYKILADHKLSSREYRPTITDKGELAFVKIEQPPKP